VIEERDARIAELESQLGTATNALRDVTTRDRLVEQFSKHGVKAPFKVASRALSEFQDVTADTPDADLEARTKAWFDDQAALFSTGETIERQPQPNTPFAQVEPNLTAPGLAPKATSVVVGSSDFFEQGWHNRSDAEQLAAMRSGELVTSEKVKVQQQASPFGG